MTTVQATLDAYLHHFRDEVLREDMSERELRLVRLSFYSGAACSLTILGRGVGDRDAIVRSIDAMLDELEAYAAIEPDKDLKR